MQVLSSITKDGTFIVDDSKLIEKEIVNEIDYNKNESLLQYQAFQINQAYLHKYLVI